EPFLLGCHRCSTAHSTIVALSNSWLPRRNLRHRKGQMRTLTRTMALVGCIALCAAAAVGAQRTNARDPLLVTPQWLAAHLRDPNLVILHVGDPSMYAASHIPGARLIELPDISVTDMA